MLEPKKVIPSLASACLTLTGCGGDSSIPGGVTNAIGDWCVKVAECYSDYSVKECVDYYIAYAENYIDFSNPACEPALVSYLDCLSALSCAELETSDACDAQGEAVDEKCYAVQE